MPMIVILVIVVALFLKLIGYHPLIVVYFWLVLSMSNVPLFHQLMRVERFPHVQVSMSSRHTLIFKEPLISWK
jgi:hypothetical protein